MSKQSNQRYRKEKEKDNFKKAGLDSSASNSADNRQDQDKINKKFDNISNKADR